MLATLPVGRVPASALQLTVSACPALSLVASASAKYPDTCNWPRSASWTNPELDELDDDEEDPFPELAPPPPAPPAPPDPDEDEDDEEDPLDEPPTDPLTAVTVP